MKRRVIKQQKINSIIIDSNEQKKLSYIPIDKRLLKLADKIDFKIFSADNKTQMSLFLQAGSVIDQEKKSKLEHIERVFALESEKNKYNNFLEKHIQDVVNDKNLSLDEKTDIIYESSSDLTKDLYSNPDALQNSKLSENIISPILDTVLHNNDTISSYIKIIEYDYYTYTHSLNVSVYALCLGAALNLDKETLTALGKSALLHDIGKSKINPQIVNKKGMLNDEEFEVMKNHPSLGYEIALKYKINDKNILDGIKHHHEKVDGQGYPDNLSNGNLSLFPRIISICDVFDALTTRRSYKEAMRSFDALMVMKTHMDTHFDKSILNTFIKMLHK